MIALRASLLLSLLLLCPVKGWCDTQSPQAAHDDGVATGYSQIGGIRSGLSDSTAKGQSPGYTTNPGQKSLYTSNPTAMTDQATQLIALCRSTPDYPDCEPILQAQDSAYTRVTTTTVSPNDPSILGSKAVQNQPQSVIGSITTSYSDCQNVTTPTSAPQSNIQSCYTYLQRSLNNVCVKDLTVNVTWTCQPGMTGPRDDGKNYLCNGPVTHIGYTCDDADEKTGSCRSSTPYTYIVIEDVIATPVETDTWTGCEALEGRVPPGGLPPDGLNGMPMSPMGNGRPDKCERQTSTCSSGPAQTLINRHLVKRACWRFSNDFTCVDPTANSDCAQPKFGQCTLASAPYCSEYDPLDPQICNVTKSDYACRISNGASSTDVNCAGRTFTADGVKWDVSYQPNKGFNSAVAAMEAGREAARSFDPADIQIFKGFDNRCTKKLFGLVNCCNGGGTDSRAITDFTMVAAASKYTYGWMFGDQAAKMLPGPLQSLGGMGALSIQEAVMPGTWAITIIALQLSGLMTCSKDEKNLAMKRDANLCVDLGDYCSRRLPIIRTCMETTRTYCCFTSRLAKLINVQGKAQLGIGMGNAGNPNCGGFTVSQFQSLDLSRMDLTEFYADIQPKNLTSPLSPGSTTPGDINPSNCVAGQGACTPGG